MHPTTKKIRAFFVCTGVDLSRRGIESFFREAFEGLKNVPGLDITLYKGGGQTREREIRLFCIPKESKLGILGGFLTRRQPYIFEQMTFLPSIIRQIKKHQPDVIYSSDANILIRLYRRRKKTGEAYRLLYSNGAPMPSPIKYCDFVQQVTPFYYDDSIRNDKPERNHFVPYGFTVPEGNPLIDPAERRQIRQRLGLPMDRKIVLTVGAIGMKTHKRMPHLIREIGLMKEPRPFLLMLGPVEEGGEEITGLLDQQLGRGNYQITSVPYQLVNDYYKASDVFALASLLEGFGRVYVEALVAGLPCVVHDHLIMRYVFDGLGYLVDMKEPGACARALENELSKPFDPDAAIRRRESIRTRLSWKSLENQYLELFKKAVAAPIDTTCR